LNKHGWGASSFACLTLTLFAWRGATAQLVATKEITNAAPDEAQQTRTPQHASPTTNSENIRKSDCFVGYRDGVTVPNVPEKLRLEIASVDPKVVRPGTDLLVTVRLTNVGANGVLVPWDTPSAKPDIDPKTGILSWDAASITLSFATLEDPQNRRKLKGEALLAAAPSHREQHVELLPGQWLDVKFTVALECNSSHSSACHELPVNGDAVLTAHWSEWLSTYEDDGCNVWKGTYESWDVDSELVPVVYVATSPVGNEKPAPHR